MNSDQIIADFRVDNATELKERLDAAVQVARQQAIAGHLGILVTRHEFTHFSVSLSRRVPFGTTFERDLARRKGPASGQPATVRKGNFTCPLSFKQTGQ